MEASSLAPTCPHCGAVIDHVQTDAGAEAQQRILELESQVKILTGKATAAVDKLADYEDQLHALRPASPSPPTSRPALTTSTSETDLPTSRRPSSEVARPATALASTSSSNTPSAAAVTTARTSLLPVQTRFSAFLSRKSTPTPTPTAPTHPSPTHPSPPLTPTIPHPPPDSDLSAQLQHEKTLRQAAETRLTQLNGEIEDLSASLFSEANEMVANERRVRAKLEKRIEVLEAQVAEGGAKGKEGERAKRMERLERLEGAVGRVERIRGLLSQEEGGR